MRNLFNCRVLCLVLCIVSYQQCLAQNSMNEIANEIMAAMNLTDTGGEVPSLGSLLAPMQNEVMLRAEEALSDFVKGNGTQYDVSEKCLNDVEAWLAALSRREYWALRMIDAMGKPPSGLQEFHITWVGSWSECLSVEAYAFQDPIHQNGTFRQFGGQYCRATVALKGLPAAFGQGAALNIGFCVPDSCLNTDSGALFNLLLDIIPINLTASIVTPAKVQCQEKELEYSTAAIISLVVCGVFAVIIAVATTYDIVIQKMQNKAVSAYQMSDDATLKGSYKETPSYDSNGHTHLEGKTNGAFVVSDHDVSPVVNGDLEKGKRTPAPIEFSQTSYTPGTAGKLLLSFSVYTNAPKILNAKQPAGTLTSVNGIRFLSMTWVMLGHTYGFGLQSVENVAMYASTMFKRLTFQAIENATVSVDTFFVLSGLLVAYLSLKEMKKCGGAKKFKWGMFYFHRYWRLTPPYMLFLMVYVTTFKYWGDGPFWPQQGVEVNDCKDSWWMNLLYINNFFGMDKQCMGWSWYLNNDMQFYVLSPIMLIPLFHLPILGGIVCLALLLVNFVSAGIISYNDKMTANFMLNPDQNAAFTDYYFRPWCRIGPYVVGYILGYILFKTECKPKLTKLTNAVGWIIATALALTVLYGLYSSDGVETLSQRTAAVYNATHRTVWGACVAWVIYACATGFGGPVNALLSWEGIVPLSRLTYCAYLVHPAVMYLYYSSHRQLAYWYDFGVAYEFLGHLCVTYGAAFVVSLAFESPMMGLEKVLLGRKKSS